MSKAHKEYSRRINQSGHGATGDSTTIEETDRRILNERQFKLIRPYIEDLNRAASQSQRSDFILQSIGKERTAPDVHQGMRAQASRARNDSRSGTEQPRDDQSSVSNNADRTTNHDPADGNESDSCPNDDALDAAPCRTSARRDYTEQTVLKKNVATTLLTRPLCLLILTLLGKSQDTISLFQTRYWNAWPRLRTSL